MSYALVYFPPDGDRDFILDCLKNSDCVFHTADTIEGLTSFALKLDAEKLKNPSPATEKDESCNDRKKDVMARSFVQSQSFISETMVQKTAVKVEDEHYDDKSSKIDPSSFNEAQASGADSPQEPIVIIDGPTIDKYLASDVMDNHPVLCDKCHKSLLKEDLVKRPHECTVCGEKFRKPSGLHRHRLVVHSLDRNSQPATKQLACTFCGKTFHLPYTLRRHMRSHTVEKPFACAECDYKAAKKISLLKHIKRHHT